MLIAISAMRAVRPDIFSMVRLLVLIWCASGALAQPATPLNAGEVRIETPPRQDDQPRVTRVRWGFGPSGLSSSEAWSPLVVEVASGNRSWGGLLEVTYPQDAVQHARVLASVSTTPGRSTPVEFFLPLPASAAQMTIRLRDSEGRERALVTLGPQAALQFPGVRLPARNLVLTGDDLGLAELWQQFATTGFVPSVAAVDEASGEPTDEVADRWSELSIAAAPLSEWPSLPIGYDGIRLIVMRAASLAAAPPRTRSAIVGWLNAGGSLVLLADTPGFNWGLISNGDGSSPVELIPSREWSMPDAAAIALTRGSTREYPKGAGGRTPSGSPAATSLLATGFSLTPHGVRDGWRLAWAGAPRDGRDAGLIASGPVGLGRVLLLGAPPSVVATVLDPTATLRAWIDVLGQVAPEYALKVLPNDTNVWSNRAMSSGVDQVEAAAIARGLDSLATVRTVGDRAFIALGACLLGLAVLLGPVDALVLRLLNQRRWAWATALGWIAIATALATILPGVFREGDSTIRRLSVVDAVQPADRPVDAWQTSLTGIFANHPLSINCGQPQVASWWRAVSSVPNWGESSNAFLGSAVTLVQTEPAGEGAAARSAWPAPIPIPQWTFRTLLDRSPAKPPCRVKLERVGGEWRLTLQDLPSRVAIQRGEITLADGARTIPLGAPQSGATGERVYYIAMSDPPAPLKLSSPEPGAEGSINAPLAETTGWSADPWGPGSTWSLNLPGVRQRTWAMFTRVAAGGAALVTLHLVDLPPDVEFDSGDEPMQMRRDMVLRVLIPLTEAAPSPAPDAAPAPTAPAGAAS